MPAPRVNFAGTTAIPRVNTKNGKPFLSCFAPLRDVEGHQNLNFAVNSEEEVAAIILVGVVELSELTTSEEPYVNSDGEDAVELTTTPGAIRTRGAW